jgi:hypothetical protein
VLIGFNKNSQPNIGLCFETTVKAHSKFVCQLYKGGPVVRSRADLVEIPTRLLAAFSTFPHLDKFEIFRQQFVHNLNCMNNENESEQSNIDETIKKKEKDLSIRNNSPCAPVPND